MDLQLGQHMGVDRPQKLAALDRAMPLVRVAEHGAGLGVEGGKQRRRPVPSIVMRAALDLARLHRQHRRRPIQG